LDALTVFVSNSSDTEFRERLKDWVDVEDVKNWWAFVLFLSATDNRQVWGQNSSTSPIPTCMKASTSNSQIRRAKNMYVYSDADAEKPFFRFITWDLNAIMGFDWWTDKVAIWEPPLFDLHFIDCNHIWERMYADPALKAELAEHMAKHLKGVFSDSLEAAIRAVYNEIEFAGARSHRRWGTAYREFEDWTYRTEFLEPEEEVQFMLEWVQGRRALVKWQLESEHAGLAMG
jgi:spore coat protein H